MEREKRGGDVVKAAASDGVRRKLNTSCLATVFFSLPSLHWFFRQAAAERGGERETEEEGGDGAEVRKRIDLIEQIAVNEP